MNTPEATTRTCPQCGQPMPVDAPEGLCGRCLMSAAMHVRTTVDPVLNPAKPPDIDTIGKYFPQLEILELLGRGGMGMVYKARQRALDRVVALKVLPPTDGRDPEFAERFTREARALARLNHPNIVGVFEFGQTPAPATGGEGLYYFIMEYVDGANLRHLIRSKSIAPAEALAIVPKICEALQFAHEEGVTHRDIKPENILVDKRGRVKIADFGLAKILGADNADFNLTQTGVSLGTPRYMAPEQVEDPAHVDHRADIYSLGVVFYEMLTGELPMGRFAPPSQKAQIDVRLDEVVLRSLEKDVERRYQQASHVKTDVENISGILNQLPARVRQMIGYERRSKATIFGLPLVHLAFGIDPATGKARVAKGVIAIGERARGVVAFGAHATGVFVFGALGIGVVSFSGVSIGVVSIGGIALGLLFGFGGVAIAPFALGGFSIGWLAAGGAAIGKHMMSSAVKDAYAVEFFQTWHERIMSIFYILLPFSVGVPIVSRFLGERWMAPPVEGSSGAGKGRPAQERPVGEVARKPARRHLLSAIVSVVFLMTFFMGLDFQAKSYAEHGGRAAITMVGSFDPWFFRESGPMGFAYWVNPFSWSGLLLGVSVVLFLALIRIDREDDGKVQRDPAWWSGWWKQSGFWLGLVLVICVMRTVRDPQKVLRPFSERKVSEKYLAAPDPKSAEPKVEMDGKR